MRAEHMPIPYHQTRRSKFKFDDSVAAPQGATGQGAPGAHEALQRSKADGPTDQPKNIGNLNFTKRRLISQRLSTLSASPCSMACLQQLYAPFATGAMESHRTSLHNWKAATLPSNTESSGWLVVLHALPLLRQRCPVPCYSIAAAYTAHISL